MTAKPITLIISGLNPSAIPARGSFRMEWEVQGHNLAAQWHAGSGYIVTRKADNLADSSFDHYTNRAELVEDLWRIHNR